VGVQPVNKRFARAISGAALVATLAACGSPVSPGAGSQGAGGAAPTLQPGGVGLATPAGSGAGPVTGHVGDKLNFLERTGDAVDATLVKVTDPATPNDAGEAPLATGVHWVGVEVTVDNHSSDAPSQASEFDATTSTGTTVTTADTYNGGSYVLGDGFQGCTQTSGSEQDVQPYTHCLAFPVPDGQTLTQVGVRVGGASIDAPGATDQAVWTIP
jgi:hypothetical protein